MYICPYLLFRNLQHLSGVQHVTLEAVQLHDLGIAAAFAEVGLCDLPERVAVLDGIRPACGFRFRRDRLAGEDVVILLYGRKECVPVRQDILRIILLLDTENEPDENKRLDKAFRYFGQDADLALFDQYVLGGVEVLYEKLIEGEGEASEYINLW